MDISSLTGSSSESSASSVATANLTQDFDAFLNLLTTQITNQDPTNPLDSTQFVEQLATFSGLEQQVASNAHLESIVELLQGALGERSAQLIGQQAGAAAISIAGPIPAVPVAANGVSVGTLVVENTSGQEVFRGTPGADWSWNGRTSDGEAAPAGTYRFYIEDNGNRVPAFAVGTIDRVISTEAGEQVGLGEGVLASQYTLL